MQQYFKKELQGTEVITEPVIIVPPKVYSTFMQQTDPIVDESK